MTSVAVADDAFVDRVVVTATRTPTVISAIGESVTLITSSELRATQKTAVADVLSMTPGVSLSRNGGLGTSTSLRIRGADADQTVVLIDGVKLNDPSAAGGGFNFGSLFVNDIARIEVLRGAQTTLWGSQAIGGVVNIVTPEPSGSLSTSLDVQGGSYRTLQAIARVEAGRENYGWRLGTSYLTTDGVSAFDERLGGQEDDGYRNVGFNARAFVRLSDNAIAEARTTWSRGRVEFDGFPPPTFSFRDSAEYGTTDESVSYVGMKFGSFANSLQHRIGVAYTTTDRDNTDPRSQVPTTLDAQGTNLRYEYQGTFEVNDAIGGVFGAEHERSALRTSSPTAFDPSPTPLDRDVDLQSVYAQLRVRPLHALTLTGGLRYDDHETFGGARSPQLAAAWSASNSTLLRASFGEGFKAPTLYQLYSQYGTPTLDAEASDDWDVGVEQQVFDRRVTVAATYFERNTDNMIDFVSCFGVVSSRCASQPDGYYENVAQTVATGYELSMTAQLAAKLHLSANYTSLDARNDSRGTANFGKLLPRRPRDTANVQLTYDWHIPLTTAIAAQYVGRTFDNAANTFTLDKYLLVDVLATYRLSASVELYGRIENAFDEQYQTARRYGSLGRAAYFGVRVTP